MTNVPLDSYKSIANAVTHIKKNDDVKELLKQHEDVLDDVCEIMLPKMIGVKSTMWNYVSFLSYHARQISIFTPASETPVLTCYPNSIPKFTSQARAKLAGVAFALHVIFSSQMIYANIVKCSSSPVHKSLFSTKLKSSTTVTKLFTFSYGKDLTSLEQIKQALEDAKKVSSDNEDDA